MGILRQYGDLKKLLHVIQKDHEKTPRKLISFFLFIKQRMIETKKTKSKCILKLLLLKTNYLWVYNFRTKEKQTQNENQIM